MRLKNLIRALVLVLVLSIPLASYAQQIFVTKSLAAATATGAGTSSSSFGLLSKHSWHVIVTGSPASVTVNLEGTIDGSNWFTLDSSTTTTSEMRHVVNKPVTQIRANLATLTGGSSPTVTVTIASGGN